MRHWANADSLLAIVPKRTGADRDPDPNQSKSWKTGIVMLAVPFSTVGALWALYLLGYHMSTAVWVGMIALMGVDAQAGVFMLLYLDLAYEAALSAGRLHNSADLK
jgi:Cu(I)/Ag(I) efflux system membrane protein CusA/SilA